MPEHGAVPEASTAAIAVSQHYTGPEGEKYLAWQRGAGEKAGRLEAAMFKSYVQADDTVVDFGCGGGFFLKALPCRVKSGVEVNPAALALCRTNGIRAVPDVTGVPAASASLVTSIHSLEHTLHPLAALHELHRILQERGRLLLCTPVDDWRVYRRYDPADIHHHLYTWSAQNLGNLLSEAGFRVQSIETWTFAWPPKWAHFVHLMPWPAFAFLCRLWGWLSRYRQLVAVAYKS